MDRKNFIKTAGLGIGVALIPEAAISEGLLNKETSTANLKSKIIRDGEGNVVNVLGDIQTHILVGSDTDNQIVEWVDDVEPGVGIPPHIHTKEDEIFRVIEGQIEIMVDGKTTVLKAGDTAFAPKNIPHSWTVVGTEKAKMITSAFPAGIEMMFKELADLPPGPPDFEKVAKICGNHGISFLK
ncbi:cupin domain-containing protein [Cyclobacterium marinum]|uniref:Cupin 2 conserved barrel domain protein n=1 Tax=Cyclobacterium marinum (strain ATCC 25205 / DSM 745 / LMG 13164 / NCIMB 1802) TaxID=880070 RepID=G0J4T4_CYCMS|nr:cupin domain-containing protein [Cyclobacterium marinum]AEL25314.1 Cupin 2 conserved barrel domain protein [Cyclobacterium marinum DSM 745]MBI0400608.1 cupin domain-containing protein [Cyclobacterium marinum]